MYSDVRKRCSHPIYYQGISRKQSKSDLEKLTVARLRTRLRPSISLSDSASWGLRKWSHRCNNSYTRRTRGRGKPGGRLFSAMRHSLARLLTSLAPEILKVVSLCPYSNDGQVLSATTCQIALGRSHQHIRVITHSSSQQSREHWVYTSVRECPGREVSEGSCEVRVHEDIIG